MSGNTGSAGLISMRLTERRQRRKKSGSGPDQPVEPAALGRVISVARVSRWAENVIARGWLEAVYPSLPQGVVALQLREAGRVRVVWVTTECFEAQAPTLQSVLVIRSAAISNSVELPATDIELVTRAELPAAGAEPWALHIRAAASRDALVVASLAERYAREFMDSRGCIGLQPSVLSERASTVAPDASVMPDRGAQSQALNAGGWMWINAMVTALERVYAICPIVREQTSGTPLHLAPQWLLQAEIAWATGEEIMQWEEGLLRHVGERLLDRHAPLLPPGSEQRLGAWRRPLPIVRYDEALALLAAAGAKPAPGCEFTGRERALLDQKFSSPYFIAEIPIGLAPLATRTAADAPQVSCSHRLMSGSDQAPLAIGGERVSAWQAEPSLPQRGLRATRSDPLQSVAWFADTRRYGCVPHSGFEMQLNALVALALGVNLAEFDARGRSPYG